MIAGLAFQVVSLSLFAAVGIDLWQHIRRSRETERNPMFGLVRNRTLFKCLPIGLAAATIFIYIRCVFRCAELWGGFDSKLANNETAFMIFEGPMLFAAVLALTIFHPGICFGSKDALKSAKWTWKKQPEYPQQFQKSFDSTSDAGMDYEMQSGRAFA